MDRKSGADIILIHWLPHLASFCFIVLYGFGGINIYLFFLRIGGGSNIACRTSPRSRSKSCIFLLHCLLRFWGYKYLSIFPQCLNQDLKSGSIWGRHYFDALLAAARLVPETKEEAASWGLQIFIYFFPLELAAVQTELMCLNQDLKSGRIIGINIYLFFPPGNWWRGSNEQKMCLQQLIERGTESGWVNDGPMPISIKTIYIFYLLEPFNAMYGKTNPHKQQKLRTMNGLADKNWQIKRSNSRWQPEGGFTKAQQRHGKGNRTHQYILHTASKVYNA